MANKLYTALWVISLILLTSNSYGFDKWTKEDKVLQSVQATVHIIDWLQTREIARNDDYYESNPLMGKYPTVSEVDRYMSSSALLNLTVTHILPQKYRKYWLSFWIGVSSAMVFHNYNIGVRISF